MGSCVNYCLFITPILCCIVHVVVVFVVAVVSSAL